MAGWKDLAIYYSSQIFGKIDPRRRLVVLTLHRVEGASPIKSEHVRQHFEYLADHYKIILPSQLSSEESSADHRHLAMVVIDDCHFDAYRHIYPLAKSCRVPITIATPTDFFLRNKWLWFDKFYWLLARQAGNRRFHVGEYLLDLEQPKSIIGFKKLLKANLPAARDRLLDEMSAKMGFPFPETPADEYRPVARNEMKEMLASGLVEISVHSVTHPIVSLLNEQDLEFELRQAKRELEEFAGTEIISFCYPNGQIGDFNARTEEALKRAGYQMAFTTVPGRNILKKYDRFAIKRVHIHPRLSMFAKETTAMADIQDSLHG